MSSDTLIKVLDHGQEAADRLLEQYKDKQTIIDLIKIFADKYQEIEDVGFSMYLERTIDGSVGTQLDNLGTIVVLDRNGFSDDDYRRLLKVKISINIGKGRIEQIINTILLLTQATQTHVVNLNRAQIAIYINTTIDSSLVNFIYNNIQRSPSAGVRINYIACYDALESFSFGGSGPFGLGLSSEAAPTTGGKFAFIHKKIIPFAFALSTTDQGSDEALGFGSIKDPWAGGNLEGL